MIAERVDLAGPCHAWYPLGGAATEEGILVWVAPADGEWAVYGEAVHGPLGESRVTGVDTELGAVTLAEEWLVAALWVPTPPWPL